MPSSPTNPPDTTKSDWLSTILRSFFAKKKTHEVEPKNLVREMFETVVFVLVLVLMLQRFVAEAFVIPTGSMAETLYGDHEMVTCRECGYKSPLNSSSNDFGQRSIITSYICSNCGYKFIAKTDSTGKVLKEDAVDFSGVRSGDRVLVLKPAYYINPPKRFDVPVFKWPVEPFSVRERVPTNYIKRLVGLPGETIAVFDGDLYLCKDLKYPDEKLPEDPNNLWLYPNMYPSHPDAISAFEQGKFEIIRKSPTDILAQRIIVFDMDHQPASLKGIAKTRWHAQPGYDKEWQARETGFKHTGSDLGWIRYHHLASWQDQPSLEPMEINDSLGYNQTRSSPSLEVVTDLILECKADFQSKDAQLILELNKGPYRFQAVFDGGNCTLIRVDANDNDKSTVLSKTSSGITGEGRHEIRLANVDCRLTVWVDNKVLSFDKGADYTIPHVHQSHPNDRMQPARIGSRGDVTCDSIRIWRDIFYTCGTNGGRQGYGAIQEKFFPPSYNPCSTVQTFYVQPGHYLCFGDNSTSSLDGRMWGLVPERLLLGKAVMVYFPLSRFGVIK